MNNYKINIFIAKLIFKATKNLKKRYFFYNNQVFASILFFLNICIIL